MRVLDDAVDHGFQALNPTLRQNHRSAWLAWARRMKRRVVSGGLFSGFGRVQNQASARKWPGSDRLRYDTGDLARESFLRLLDALCDDIREVRLQRWEDVYGYAEGAAVAPAALFIALAHAAHSRNRCRPLSSSRNSGTRRFLFPGPAFDPFALARPIAMYCYLSHISRDLKEDVNAACEANGKADRRATRERNSGRLVTLPEALAQRACQSEAGIKEARAEIASQMSFMAPQVRRNMRRLRKLGVLGPVLRVLAPYATHQAVLGR